MHVIRRDDGARGDVFAWFGGTLQAESQLQCEPNEAVLVLDDQEEVVTTLGPGRHALPSELKPYVGRDDLLFIFVTTGTMRIEAGGALDDVMDEPWLELFAQVSVKDPVKAIELLPLLDEDEAPEDWIAEELILAVSHAARERRVGLEGLRAATADIARAAAGYANEAFAEVGLEVGVPEMAFSDAEDAD